jgi:CHAD domain-containing protein
VAIALSRKRKAADGLRRQLVDDVAAARDTLLDAGTGLDERIHKARRRLKRARTILRALRPLAGKAAKRQGRRLGDIARSLSAARDADVMAATAQGLAEQAEAADAATMWRLAERLAERARAVHADKPPTEAAATALGEEAQLAAALAWAPDAERADVLLEGLATTYRDGRRAMAIAEDAPGDETLHEWRKAVKHRWHLSKLAQKRTGAAAAGVVAALDELGELLGVDHDLAVLAELVIGEPALAGGETDAGRALAAISARRQQLQADAMALGRILYADKPRDFGERLAEPVTAGPA